jgi:hypothetical protein
VKFRAVCKQWQKQVDTPYFKQVQRLLQKKEDKKQGQHCKIKPINQKFEVNVRIFVVYFQLII